MECLVSIAYMPASSVLAWYLVHSLNLLMHTQVQQRKPQAVDYCVSPNRFPGANLRQYLMTTCTRVPCKRCQNKHTHLPALGSIRTVPKYFHKWHIQRKISASTEPC